ncbi:hypothetical protein EDD86DRAFT_200420 [Gorgonomyces haynaldii]|nr:hypothetical protein EDD86DRAFT_200420 [Gorgonomyces haynaldii]
MGPKVGRKRQHHSIRDNQRKFRTRARTRDLDQVFEDMQKKQQVLEKFKTEEDQDLPGMGQHYCVECARHFIGEQEYIVHCRTKLHKKRVKTLKNETAYTQKDAELAAGLQTDNGRL